MTKYWREVDFRYNLRVTLLEEGITYLFFLEFTRTYINEVKESFLSKLKKRIFHESEIISKKTVKYIKKER
jgi:hypothetical protein